MGQPFTGTVAVTGLNATDNPGPGVAVARSLRNDPEFQGKIVGLAYDAMDPGLYMDGLLDAAYVIPYPSAGRQAMFDRLAYIQERTPIDVMLPNLDAELPALMGQEAILEELGIRTFLPSRDAYDARSKGRLDKLNEHGVPVPRSELLSEVAPLYTVHERFGFPIVVKGVFYGAEVARSVDEAVKAFHKAAATWGLPVILQEYVEGEEVNVAAVGDGRGGLVGAVAMKKLMLTDKGKGWAGVTILDKGLMKLTQDIVGALQWRGPCEIEVRKERGGAYHLMEVNPRMPAWIDLTQGAGQNLPLACARLAAGEDVGTLPAYRPGVAFIRISLDQIVDISQLESIATRGEVLPAATERSA
ncbi:MAG: ATP-grasp domain-containing protein [Alphaproteobacteria bacterium]|nr:ATP-grasp domain-containing protein [Alphaproteobacteria bacterium]